MTDRKRSVLHILPHPGGGGETYVDSLSEIDGYISERLYLAPSPQKSSAVLPVLTRGVLSLPRLARRHDLLHAHGEVAAGISLPSLAMSPSVVTLHGLHLLRRAEGAVALAARANLRLIVRTADRTICVSDAERPEVLDVVAQATAPRVVTIRNGVRPQAPIDAQERERARAAFSLNSGDVVGALVGSLDTRKDPLVPVRAAVEAGAGLLVAGDGPLRPELVMLARTHPAIRVLGHRTDVRQVLVAADFFVLSSWREGLSYALLEAMALALPVVVSDVPGNAETVGEAGIVVRTGDVQGFASAFARLVGDASERLRLGELAHARVLTEFSLDAMVAHTGELYDAVLRERHVA